MTDDTARDDDTAATLKSRRRSSRTATGSERRQTATIEPDPPGPAPIDSSPGLPAHGTASSGVSHHSLGGPSTLVGSFTSEGIAYGSAGDYVTPGKPGYYAFYERGAKQPTVILAWNAGQQVRKDYFERYGGVNAAATPQAAAPINEPGGGILVQH